MSLADIERELRSLLRGQHSHLMLSFNDDNGVNYQTVKEVLDDDDGREEGTRWYRFHTPEERQEACDTNSVWTLHWYPDTPIGSYTLSAPTLEKLFAYLRAEFPPPQRMEG